MPDTTEPITAVTHLATITNTVYDPDAGTVGLVGTDASGNPVLVTVPFGLVDVAVSELKRAANSALQAQASVGATMAISRTVAIKEPKTFQVGEQGEKVLVCFDIGTTEQEVKALPPKGAKVLAGQLAGMADKLNAAAARKPRLILPHH